MPSFRTGTVMDVVDEAAGLQRLEVEVDGERRRAVSFTRNAPAAVPGDRVVLNVTARELGLGSGGEDFVVWNLSHERHDAPSGGHIVKLRYTPGQADVLAVEEEVSAHHPAMRETTSLDGIPVVAASLHSQLLPVVVGIRMHHEDLRVVYVMTDGAALEAGLSRTLERLRELGWVSSTVTCGHALGGDLEAVSLHSALLAARAVAGADLVVVGMGPGVVGTGTPFGTTALELGIILNATASLGGQPVACVRMSEGDPRERHQGLSHHARVALERVALAPAVVPVPFGNAVAISGGHRLVEVPTAGFLEALGDAGELGLRASHMGRGIGEDPLFFAAAGAAGLHAASLAAQGR